MPTQPPPIEPNEAMDRVTNLNLMEAREVIGPLARAGQPVPPELSAHVFALWRFLEQWLYADDQINLTPAEFEKLYSQGTQAVLVRDKSAAQKAWEEDQRTLDRILWAAREAAEMFNDVLQKRMVFGPSDDALTELVGEIDEYRREHGFRSNGFG